MNVWFAPSIIRGGDQFPQEIEIGLQKSQTVVVLLSNSSIKSFWVKKEWGSRLVQMSKDKTLKLIPLSIDDCSIPVLLNDFHYINFRKVDFNNMQPFEDKVQELIDSINEVLPPPGTTTIGIPIAVIAMTQTEAEELVSFTIFNKSEVNVSQRNRFKQFFSSLKKIKMDNFVERYAENREEFRPFKSDSRTIRKIIEDITNSVNQTEQFGSNVIIRPQYYSNDFLSNDINIRGKTWDYLEHLGCVLILDGISMFHPTIQAKFSMSHLGVKERVAIVCISPLNPRDFDPIKILETEVHERLQRVFERYYISLDPQCSFEVGDERTLNRWLFTILPKTFKTVRKQKANPNWRELYRNIRGQPAGQSQLIFGER